MSDYIQVDIHLIPGPERDLLIARLAEIGFDGFEEERMTLKAFIPQEGFDETLLNETIGPEPSGYSTSIIQQKNWNELWEAGFDPVIVNDFCAIRAEFHPAIEGVSHEIIITPKMSFGTGHHATTFMMISALQTIDCKQKSVFDFGTGTGVLAILAEKLGAAKIEAIDIDDWSIENGKENLQKNDCRKIHIYKSESIPAFGKYNLVLANINRNIILSHLEAIRQSLLPGGILVISGFLTGDFEDMLAAANRLQLSLSQKQFNNDWVCMTLLYNVED